MRAGTSFVGVNRRTVLRLSGTLIGAAVLAACGDTAAPTAVVQAVATSPAGGGGLLAGDKFIGTWAGPHLTLTISKQGTQYIVKGNNPDGMVNGTFAGEYVGGKLKMSPPNFGDIIYVDATNTLLFAGEELRRKA